MRLVFADDHTMVRESLARVSEINPSISVVGQAGDGAELRQVLEQTRPDFLVMDYSMPNHRAVDAIGEFLEIYPRLKIVVLTVHENIHYAVQVLRAGAHGYLIKAAAVDELMDAIDAVRYGNVYISRQIADKVWSQMRTQKAGQSGLGSLSTRELEVLKLLAEGKALQDCASHLGIKVSTVSTYRGRIMDKLSLETNSDLVRFAIQNQIVD